MLFVINYLQIVIDRPPIAFRKYHVDFLYINMSDFEQYAQMFLILLEYKYLHVGIETILYDLILIDNKIKINDVII